MITIFFQPFITMIACFVSWFYALMNTRTHWLFCDAYIVDESIFSDQIYFISSLCDWCHKMLGSVIGQNSNNLIIFYCNFINVVYIFKKLSITIKVLRRLTKGTNRSTIPMKVTNSNIKTSSPAIGRSAHNFLVPLLFNAFMNT